MTLPRLRAVLFDKDGTLFGFRATWDAWAHGTLSGLAKGDTAVLDRLAAAVRYDLDARAFHDDSPAIAGTNRETAALLQPLLPGWTIPDLERHLSERAATVPLVPATDLPRLLDALERLGLTLGVVTNDSEASALSHLDRAEVRSRFSFVAGFDSGFGAKPDPGPLDAFAAHHGLDPREVLMVGDSTHDLLAARAAGMRCAAVLTGTATQQVLAPLSDVVLPDIGHLPDWIIAASG